MQMQMRGRSRMETKSPRSEGGFDRDLAAFLQEEHSADDKRQTKQEDPVPAWNGSISSPVQTRHSQDDGRRGEDLQEIPSARQRTKSHPVKLHHIKPISNKHVTPQEDMQRCDELLTELLLLDASLRKQAKNGNRKATQKHSKSPNESGSTLFSVFSLGALKKPKSTGHIKIEDLMAGEKVPVPPLPMKVREMSISAPLQARHVCTGALNPNANRESPFGRRPLSPIRGYIDFPSAGSESVSSIDNPLLLGFDIRSNENMVSPIGDCNSSRSSPSQSNLSEAYPSPAFFSSPISSTSSHSEEGPSTPRALSPSINSNNGAADFWAVSFAEAQAGEEDFVAPHATLVKSNKLAMLSTNEKARRRASKASVKT